MIYSSGDLRKLAGKKRSRNNLEEVQSVLSEMEETKDSIDSWVEKVKEVRDAGTELLELHDEMDSDLLGSDTMEAIRSAVENLNGVLPEDGDALSEFSDHYDSAVSAAEDLESYLEDRDYSADERDEKWDEVGEYLGYMADALDELATLHKRPAVKTGGE